MEAPSISEAVIIWTGYDKSARPSPGDSHLIERFGADVPLELITEVHRLYEEFYASDARLTSRDIMEMGRQASDRFRGLHPEIHEDAVKALAWCYTFDFK
jgi:hypothetical protein